MNNHYNLPTGEFNRQEARRAKLSGKSVKDFKLKRLGQKRVSYARLKDKDPVRFKATRLACSLRNNGVKGFGVAELVEILKAGITCPYCSLNVDLWQISVDHILPKSRGGSDDRSNIHFTCATCNALKGSWTEEEFITALNIRKQLPEMWELFAKRMNLKRLRMGSAVIESK